MPSFLHTAAYWPDLPPDAEEPDSAYRSVLAWVWSFSAAPRTPATIAEQRTRKLDRMRFILAKLDEPHTRFASLLVAGTKGKGSVVAMLASCLRAAGYRTGRYTSPHLVNWRERTAVDATPITAAEVVALAEDVTAAVSALPSELGEPTTFEVGTAFALLHFARQSVQLAVLEVGVGGRLDATNVVEPSVSTIAPISYDHTQTLGATLTEIAGHKAGILRPGRPAVSSPQPAEALRVIRAEAAALRAPLVVVGEDWCWTAGDGDTFVVTGPGGRSLAARIPLLGDHQRDNATTAIATLASLRVARADLPVADDSIRAGLATVSWPGRLQVLRRRPTLVVDGAQNAGSAAVLRQAIQGSFSYRRLWLVLGVTEGKDVRGIVQTLVPLADGVIATRSRHERAEEPTRLLVTLHDVAPGVVAEAQPDVRAALDAALARAALDDLILVTGSLFLVGETLVVERGR